jgi:hypothetical protein
MSEIERPLGSLDVNTCKIIAIFIPCVQEGIQIYPQYHAVVFSLTIFITLSSREAQRLFSFLPKIQKREQWRDYLKTNHFLEKGFSANRAYNSI